MYRFHCPECSLGDREVGHITPGTTIHCLVCYEEEGRLIRLHCWEESEDADQARLREGLLAA